MSRLFEISVLIGFALACIAVVVVPGASVRVIIANTMRHGSPAGLLTLPVRRPDWQLCWQLWLGLNRA